MQKLRGHEIEPGIGPVVTAHLAATLKSNSTLRTLEVSCNDFGDEGARHFADALKNNSTLRTLDLSCNDLVTTALAIPLKR